MKFLEAVAVEPYQAIGRIYLLRPEERRRILEEVWTQFHSYAFDFSVWEMWGALIYGGRLVVTPYLTSRSPAEFLRLLASQKVTVLNQTPSAFYQLMRAEEESAGLGEELSLRYVIFGGEALDMSGLSRWYERRGERGPKLVNMYGITETTVHVSYMEVDGREIESMRSMIGRGIADLRVYCLDGRLSPAPVGVAGELYVGGGGVARGYLRRGG